MRAVTYQAPGEGRVDEVADPVLTSPDEAIIEIEATGVCGSDLHIFHGRVPVDPGTTIGHEYVGMVTAVGVSSEIRPQTDAPTLTMLQSPGIGPSVSTSTDMYSSLLRARCSALMRATIP